jgi:hypothetical protein
MSFPLARQALMGACEQFVNNIMLIRRMDRTYGESKQGTARAKSERFRVVLSIAWKHK